MVIVPLCFLFFLAELCVVLIVTQIVLLIIVVFLGLFVSAFAIDCTA